MCFPMWLLTYVILSITFSSQLLLREYFESLIFWPLSVIPLLKTELNHKLLGTGLIPATMRGSKK
jgi:hypothetical protein